MSEELKNCPFCKSKYALRAINAKELNLKSSGFAINCDALSHGCGAVSGYRDSVEEAISLWNTRAYEAEVEALKANVALLIRIGEHDTVGILKLIEERDQFKHKLSVALEVMQTVYQSVSCKVECKQRLDKAIQQIQGNKPYPLQKFRDSMKRRQDGNFDYPIEQQWSDGSWREIKIQGKGE